MVSEARKARRLANQATPIEIILDRRRDAWKKRCEEAEAKLALVDPKAVSASIFALEKEIIKYKNLYVFFKKKGEEKDKEIELKKNRIQELSKLIDVYKFRIRAQLNYFDPQQSDIKYVKDTKDA